MRSNIMKTMALVLALLAAGGISMRAQNSELDELKAAMQSMKKSMDEMQTKIAELERENRNQKRLSTTFKTAPSAPAEGPATTSQVDAQGTQVVTIVPKAVTIEGHASEITQRPAMNDQQEAAPRPNDLTLDPKYRGFVPIPNTPVLIKFNAKPRLDFTNDAQNTGNEDRFVTATIPVDGDFFKGGGNQFNINARGSQLSIDVRAPELPGTPRFYFQNDFFASGTGEFGFRVRQLYGSLYNFVFGQTFSVFEDPDAWPDTVDYEGPNAAIFARRPLVRYQLPLNKKWQLNFGLEQPGSEVDTSIDPDARSVNHAPDGGFNVRWEDSEVGHVQFGTILRDIGVKGPITGEQTAFGWGVNLSAVFDVSERDSIQAQLTYGEGLFRYFNDDFVNNDAAFDSSGNLTPIPAFGAVVGYTHKWSDTVRSTASYGYVQLDNELSQGPNAYHVTHYGSLNTVWKMRERLSIGVEALYGKKEVQSGAEGDAFRIQFAVMYSLFD